MNWKFIFTILLLGYNLIAKAQIEDYYRAKKRKNQPFLFNHPDLVRTKSHWYMGIEGEVNGMGQYCPTI
ncbi:MAG: hypothetical protein R2822_13185 [Spirosomataceae bacterium]